MQIMITARKEKIEGYGLDASKFKYLSKHEVELVLGNAVVIDGVTWYFPYNSFRILKEKKNVRK